MPITKYFSYSTPAYEGQRDLSLGNSDVSGVMSQASVAPGQVIFSGRVVFPSSITNAGVQLTSSSSSSNALGISLLPHIYENTTFEPGFASNQAISAWDGNITGLVQEPKPAYPQLAPIPYLKKGYVWMMAESSFGINVAYTNLYVRTSSASSPALGGLGRISANSVGGQITLAVNGTSNQVPTFKVLRNFTNSNGGLILTYWDFTNGISTAV